MGRREEKEGGKGPLPSIRELPVFRAPRKRGREKGGRKKEGEKPFLIST